MVVSIIQKSQLEGAHRLDAEYYCSPRLLSGLDFYTGADVVSFVQYGTSEELNEEGRGYPVLRLNEFEESFSGVPEKYCDKLSKEQFEDLKLKKDDVLICRTNGNPALVGKSAVVMQAIDNAFASYLFRVRPDTNKINSATLVAFLNSKYGRSEIEKYLMPSIQSNFSPAKFREIKIPKFRDALRENIARLFEESFSLLQNSKFLYSQAENLLLEELGLEDFSAKGGSTSGGEADGELWNVVNMSEVNAAGRMDAEYFQPKYERLISKINSQNAKLLGDLVSIKKGIEPGAEAYQEEGKLFMRVSSISKFGLADKDQKYITDQLYKELKDNYAPKVGEVLLTKDATPGIAFVLKEKVEGVISGGILRLKLKENIDAEYLALCINSVVGQLQAVRDAGGSIIAHWKPEQIKQVQIPILPEKIQQKIAELVRQSHEARKKAKELLDEAKRKVEEMIERGGE